MPTLPHKHPAFNPLFIKTEVQELDIFFCTGISRAYCVIGTHGVLNNSVRGCFSLGNYKNLVVN